ETSLHAELSWRYAGERVSFSATGFITSFQDYIFLAETADVEDGLPVFLWAQEDADFVGAEVEFSSTLGTVGAGDVDLSLFADIVSAELDDGGNLPRISPARLGGRLEYRSDWIIAGADLVQVFDQDDVAEFESQTDGYTMFNLDLAVTVARSSQVPVELFLRGTNLLDEEARRHVSFVKDLAPLPGRNFTLGLRGRF
ncbi:MAG: TonB-dependent receptor, partial [Pseudomonadota bacterium]